MKKIMIKPFRDFWQDCFNCMVYSIIDYAHSLPRLFFYNNMYFYKFTEEVAGNKTYKSIVPWTDNFRLMDEIVKNQQLISLKDCEDPLSIIKDSIDQNKIVLAHVDLFYWIDEGLHYQNTHLFHVSLVIGYDDTNQELIVLDTGNDGYAEFKIPYERAVVAIRQSEEDESRICEIDYDADISMFTVDDLVYYGKLVVESIKDKLDKKDSIWVVDGFDDNELQEVLNIAQTHMYSMQNRQEINGYMFENAFENDLLYVESFYKAFYEMAKEFERLKAVCIRAQYRKNKADELLRVKSKMLLLLEKEMELWQTFLRYNNMKLKEFSI